MSTYVQVVLPLVLADLLKDSQVLFLDAVVLRLLTVYRLLLFHLIVIELLYVLKTTNTHTHNKLGLITQKHLQKYIQKHVCLFSGKTCYLL